MSQIASKGADLAAMLAAFEARLEGALPFREDAALLRELGPELRPVLETLACAYVGPVLDESFAAAGGQRAGRGGGRVASMAHEGFALFNLLARRAGLFGATPSAMPALARGVVSALQAAGCQLMPEEREDLLLIALEGYAAGRDELRARELRRDNADDQVACELAPACFAIFLAGAPTSERLEALLDELSRRLFRAEARSVLLDLSRLADPDEDGARALLGFITTLGSLGTQVFSCGAEQLDAWRERLGLHALGAQAATSFDAARDGALAAAGYELRRTRGRAREWLERVRPGHR
jgi:anti-anti-sigma regulatory factor